MNVGEKIECTCGAWYGDGEGHWVEALKLGVEYTIVSLKPPFVVLVDEAGKLNEFSAKLFFNKDLF